MKHEITLHDCGQAPTITIEAETPRAGQSPGRTEMSRYTIRTAKGSYTGTLRQVCAWQAEHQGSFASLDWDDDSANLDGIDFDAEDLDSAVAAVSALVEREEAAR